MVTSSLLGPGRSGALLAAAVFGFLCCGGSVAAPEAQSEPTPDPSTLPPPPPPAPEGDPELPRVYLNTAYVPPSGDTIRVAGGGDLQRALNRAQRGDIILLQPGATFTGQFTLPAKAGTGWITIATDAQLPAEGTRMTPTLAAAANLAKIVGQDDWSRVIRTAEDADASYYRLMGVEITFPDRDSESGNGGIVEFGRSPQTASSMPSHLILDRTYIHGYPNRITKRCVALNSKSSAVIDSYLDNCHSNRQDSQAIMGWNGAGPFKIANNYLAGGAEIVMFGGGDPSVADLVPSDIEIRGNHFHRPPSWRSRPTVSVKNLFELKNARRVLVEGNILEGNWRDAQTGWGINLKSTNQGGGCPWCVTEHVTIRYNVLRNSENGITMLAKSPRAERALNTVLIEHNLLVDLGPDSEFGGWGSAFQLVGGPENVMIRHNTVIARRTAIAFTGGGVSTEFEFSNNIITRGQYGVKGDGRPEGAGTLGHYAPGSSVAGNVFVGANASLYPSNNYFPANLNAVGFSNPAVGDYQLRSSSNFKGLLNGTDPGANVGEVTNHTNGVRSEPTG